MTKLPTPPLVLLDTGGRRPSGPPTGDWPTTYGSIDDVTRHIEAIDVRDGNLDLFDAEGRRVVLSAASDDGPISWALSEERYPSELQERLASCVRDLGPIRFGLLDADLDLRGLLRAHWRLDHPKTPYPDDIPAP